MTNYSIRNLAVGKLVSRGKVVDFTRATFFHDLPDAIAEIFYVCPVSNLSPTAIKRNFHFLEAAKNGLGYEFLGMLAGTEVVCTANDRHREAVGCMPGSSKHIRSRFCSGIRARGIQRALF